MLIDFYAIRSFPHKTPVITDRNLKHLAPPRARVKVSFDKPMWRHVLSHGDSYINTKFPTKMKCSTFRILPILAATVTLGVTLLPAAARAEEPVFLGVTQDYVKAVVAQDWKKCADMLLPRALERKKEETVNFIKNSSTMEIESARLAVYGLRKVEELVSMSGQEFYVRERSAVQTGAGNAGADKQLATLKIEVLATGKEEEGSFVHVVVRTHREAGEMRIHELTLVSLLQDPTNKDKWFIVPDTQLPVVQPIEPPAAPAK